jgi:hypothetical protein
MKRLILITLSVIFSCSCIAQQGKERRLFVPTFEVVAGPRFAVYPKEEVLAKSLLMYQTGALFGVEMGQSHGVTFLNAGVFLENYRYTRGEVQHITASFVDFPIHFGYRYCFNDRFSASASAGLSFLYCYHYRNNGFEIVGKDMDFSHVMGASADLSAECALSDQFSLCASVLTNFYFQQTLWVKYDYNYSSIEFPTFINVLLGVKYRPHFD